MAHTLKHFCSLLVSPIDNTALSHPVRYKLRLHYARLYAGGIVDLQSKFVCRSLDTCVCRSNLGNKRTRFTHSLHRMAHTLRHFCSYSSIGTDTRCCSNGAGFVFNITFCRWIAAVGAGSASPKPRSVSFRQNIANACASE